MIGRRHFLQSAAVAGALMAGPQAAIATACRAPAEPIHEQAYVPIGGIDQWIEIMGASQSNPALLVLNGGPGSTWDPFSDLFRDWEQHFTMVYWSQRGAGKTYRKTGPDIASTMTIERMVDDGIEVSEYLRRRLGKERIILLGHSWGTMLGVMMVQKRPELFSAYVGTGQITNVLENERAGRREVLRRARAAGRADAVAELEGMGEPPYDDIQKLVAERKWAGVFDTPSDATFDAGWKNPAWFSADDAKERGKAWMFSNLTVWGRQRMDGPFMAVDLTKTALSFRVPVILIQGSDDHITPTPLAVSYFDRISAPRKKMVLLPGGGHNAVFAMKDQFLKAMLQNLDGMVC
jgi:pimeloyl-ACP methyl ester carboxylesterase